MLYQKIGDKQQAVRYLEMFLQKAPSREYGSMFAEVREAIRECKPE